MTLYELLLIAHVLGVAVWLGGAVTNAVLLSRARRSSHPEHLVMQVETGRWVDLWLGMPAALVVLLAGSWLMIEGNWPFDTAVWIHVGMSALIAAAGIWMVWTGPSQRRLLRLASGDGDPLPLNALAGKILLGTGGSIAMMLVGLWAMIDKPSF